MYQTPNTVAVVVMMTSENFRAVLIGVRELVESEKGSFQAYERQLRRHRLQSASSQLIVNRHTASATSRTMAGGTVSLAG